MTAEDLYQHIADELAAMAPKGWSVAYVDARLLEDFGEAKFFVERPGLGRERFDPTMDGFDAIDQSLQKLRSLMSAGAGEPWSEAHVTLEASGRFNITFGYGAAQQGVQGPTSPPSAGPRP